LIDKRSALRPLKTDRFPSLSISVIHPFLPLEASTRFSYYWAFLLEIAIGPAQVTKENLNKFQD